MSSSSSVTLSADPFRFPVLVRPKLMTPRHLLKSMRMSPHLKLHISPVRRKQRKPIKSTTHKSTRDESNAIPQRPKAI
eukprot:7827390-Heterocapsa_arctica.AAC.1